MKSKIRKLLKAALLAPVVVPNPTNTSTGLPPITPATPAPPLTVRTLAGSENKTVLQGYGLELSVPVFISTENDSIINLVMESQAKKHIISVIQRLNTHFINKKITPNTFSYLNLNKLKILYGYDKPFSHKKIDQNFLLCLILSNKNSKILSIVHPHDIDVFSIHIEKEEDVSIYWVPGLLNKNKDIYGLENYIRIFIALGLLVFCLKQFGIGKNNVKYNLHRAGGLPNLDGEDLQLIRKILTDVKFLLSPVKENDLNEANIEQEYNNFGHLPGLNLSKDNKYSVNLPENVYSPQFVFTDKSRKGPFSIAGDFNTAHSAPVKSKEGISDEVYSFLEKMLAHRFDKDKEHTEKLTTAIEDLNSTINLLLQAVINSQNLSSSVVAELNQKIKKVEKNANQCYRKIKILLVESCPKDLPRMDISEELKEIFENLRQSNSFECDFDLAAQYESLRTNISDSHPQIVHFAGHGDKEGIYLRDNSGKKTLVTEKVLSEMFENHKKYESGEVECLILNACNSVEHARALNKHVKYTIGTKGRINDTTAIGCSKAFYDFLKKNKNYEGAYKNALNQLNFLKGSGKTNEEVNIVFFCSK